MFTVQASVNFLFLLNSFSSIQAEFLVSSFCFYLFCLSICVLLCLFRAAIVDANCGYMLWEAHFINLNISESRFQLFTSYAYLIRNSTLNDS